MTKNGHTYPEDLDQEVIPDISDVAKSVDGCLTEKGEDLRGEKLNNKGIKLRLLMNGDVQCSSTFIFSFRELMTCELDVSK